ncbi:protein-ER retention protein [Marasmius tenuissimus]|uniref:Protein-ER retention protein n=1 Tax=Marasmius tenuissimus TaxID=585030 RepID=A0ABR3A5Q9_9AGAR|nr:protein-ER retention protein [Marasmius tenuissimus]
MSEPDFDDEIPYSVSFPLPFRVLGLVGLGILGWATNLHGLELSGLDAPAILELRTNDGLPRTSPRLAKDSTAHYNTIYRVAGVYFAWFFATWLLYIFFTGGDPKIVDSYGYLPGILSVVVILILACPFQVFYKHERDSFLLSLRRCLFIRMNNPVYFADVVFADVLTSYAKVIGDVFLVLRMLWPGNSMLVKPVDSGWIRWLAPTVMSLPYFIRFRQCIVEWNSAANDSNRPLYNALKYATAFPVIYLSAAQNLVVQEIQDGSDNGAWHGEHPLFRLWLLAAAINSLYSYWWDVTNDWGLDLLRPKEHPSGKPEPPRRLVLPRLHSGSSLLRPYQTEAVLAELHRDRYPYGLRAILLYPLPVYPLMVFLNFVLRMTWSIKLSSHLHSKSDGTMAMFLIEVAEIVRRWMWVFVRVEWEAIKKIREEPVLDRGGTIEEMADYEMFPPTPEEEPLNMIGATSGPGKFS